MPAKRGPRLAGYTDAGDFAWSGWRLRIPGGPAGGQYHGFIAPDSDTGWGTDNGSEIAENAPDRTLYSEPGNPFLGDLPRDPWENEWGGTPLDEGETVSDHVYRSPGELRPRANASGGALTVYGYQTRRSAGFAESPGNMTPAGVAYSKNLAVPVDSYHRPCPPLPGNQTLGAQMTISQRILPAPVHGGPARSVLLPGATNVVPQPGINITGAIPVVYGGKPPGYVTVPPGTTVPISPVVSVSPTASLLPSNGLPLEDQPSTVAASPNPVMPPTPGALWLPQTSYPYGSIITDANGNLEMAVQAGVTGGIQPVWPLVPGTVTTDGGYGTAVAWELYSGSENNPAIQQENEYQQLLAQQASTAAVAPVAAAPASSLASIAGIEAWLQSSTIYAGAPNWAIVAGGAAVVWYFFLRKKR
jgi:hypothetical protein